MRTQTFRHIAVGVNTAEAEHPALATGARLARCLHAELTLVHAYSLSPPVAVSTMGPQPIPVARADRAELEAEIRHELQALAGQLGVEANCLAVESSSPATALTELAESSDIDLIVVSSHQRSGLGFFLFGSTARATHIHAPCAVLIEPHQEQVQTASGVTAKLPRTTAPNS